MTIRRFFRVFWTFFWRFTLITFITASLNNWLVTTVYRDLSVYQIGIALFLTGVVFSTLTIAYCVYAVLTSNYTKFEIIADRQKLEDTF